jgi:hypothetical protein
LLLTAVSAAGAFNWFNDPNAGTYRTAMCYLGLAFFGFATCQSIWRLISSRKPVVFIQHGGIRDTRVADELIEWRSVERISIWQRRRQSMVVLKLTPLVAGRLGAGNLRRALSVVNKTAGADGIVINPTALAMDADALFDTCSRYRAAAGAGLSGREV